MLSKCGVCYHTFPQVFIYLMACKYKKKKPYIYYGINHECKIEKQKLFLDVFFLELGKKLKDIKILHI